MLQNKLLKDEASIMMLHETKVHYSDFWVWESLTKQNEKYKKDFLSEWIFMIYNLSYERVEK